MARGRATARLFALARCLHAIVVLAGSVACRMAIVMGVVRLLPFHWLFWLVGRVLQTFGPRMLCRAIRITVQHAQGAAVALRSASRRQFLVKRLIVAVAIFLAIRTSFVAGSLQLSAQRATTIVIAIVVDVLSTISIAIDVLASSIVATRGLCGDHWRCRAPCNGGPPPLCEGGVFSTARPSSFFCS